MTPLNANLQGYNQLISRLIEARGKKIWMWKIYLNSLHSLLLTFMGTKRLDCHADLYAVSRCHTMGKPEASKHPRDPSWLWKPEQMPPIIAPPPPKKGLISSKYFRWILLIHSIFLTRSQLTDSPLKTPFQSVLQWMPSADDKEANYHKN